MVAAYVVLSEATSRSIKGQGATMMDRLGVLARMLLDSLASLLVRKLFGGAREMGFLGAIDRGLRLSGTMSGRMRFVWYCWRW